MSESEARWEAKVEELTRAKAEADKTNEELRKELKQVSTIVCVCVYVRMYVFVCLCVCVCVYVCVSV